tara:strand:+ start:38 stop:247 length:210 start_codon:yes stop_codon:yes gene_type:complete
MKGDNMKITTVLEVRESKHFTVDVKGKSPGQIIDQEINRLTDLVLDDKNLKFKSIEIDVEEIINSRLSR